MERGRKVENQHAEYQRLFSLAENSPTVERGLLSPEHVAYLLAWQEKLNPKHEERNVIVAGMGVDVSTSALAFDSTHTDGVDFMPLYIGRLEQLLKQFQQQPPKIDGQLQRQMEWHKDIQFWPEGVMNQLGRELLLLIELYSMGVDLQNASITPHKEQKKQATLQYEWKHPSAEMAHSRTLTLWNAFANLPSELQSIAAGKRVDGYYEKSLGKPLAINSASVFEEIGEHVIAPGGHMLINPESQKFYSAEAAKQSRRDNARNMVSLLEHVGSGFERIPQPLTAAKKMMAHQRSLSKKYPNMASVFQTSYGGQMACFQKK